MTQEEKQLLLRDLCARLPYGVNLHIEFYDLQGDGKLASRDVKLTAGNIGYCFDNSHWVDIKPYLRPISSMTSKEWVEFCDCSLKDEASWVLTSNRQKLIPTQNREDYLNSKHFDYRGLIPMGLAIEAPADMYKTE